MSRLANTSFLLKVLGGRRRGTKLDSFLGYNPYVFQIAIVLVVIEPITNNKSIGNRKPNIFHHGILVGIYDGLLFVGRRQSFVQQGTNLDGFWLVFL